PWSSCATPPRAGPTTTGRKPPARRPWKRCAASNADCPTWSTRRCSTTSPGTRRRAREGTRVTTLTPARPAHNPPPSLRTSHFPDPPGSSLRPPSQPRLVTEGCQMSASERALRRLLLRLPRERPNGGGRTHLALH